MQETSAWRSSLRSWRDLRSPGQEPTRHVLSTGRTLHLSRELLRRAAHVRNASILAQAPPGSGRAPPPPTRWQVPCRGRCGSGFRAEARLRRGRVLGHQIVHPLVNRIHPPSHGVAIILLEPGCLPATWRHESSVRCISNDYRECSMPVNEFLPIALLREFAALSRAAVRRRRS